MGIFAGMTGDALVLFAEHVSFLRWRLPGLQVVERVIVVARFCRMLLQQGPVVHRA